ncbi:U-box domain-containing protein 33-like [Aristolochia californica]|uniref:U-box domain-containing protein 33-like n=1 Tax=Aristolochia californica TaxID=171875 RepID=UPI0035E34DE0
MGEIFPLQDDVDDAKNRHWFSHWSGENEIEEGSIQRRLPPIEEEIAEDVYVAVGDDGSSVAALMWALKHVAKPTSSVYLIHIFPEVHRIPTPLGKFPKNQVRAEQVEVYMNEQRQKRTAMLQKFLNLCSASQVNVDTILIESDNNSKAILDLIPILNVRKLVLGTTKPSSRKLKEGNGTAEQIQKNAPESCEVKIICHGEEVSGEIVSSPSSADCSSSSLEEKEKNSTYCTCFNFQPS